MIKSAIDRRDLVLVMRPAQHFMSLEAQLMRLLAPVGMSHIQCLPNPIDHAPRTCTGSVCYFWSCWQTLEAKADRLEVNETQEAFCGFIVAGSGTAGTLELIEAPLDQIAQPVNRTVGTEACLAWLSHRDDRQNVPLVHGFANTISVIASTAEQGARCWKRIGHNQIEARIVRCLARRDLSSPGQRCGIDEEVDLSCEVTSRTPETLSHFPVSSNQWRLHWLIPL